MYKILHKDRLVYRARSGSPTILLKFFHYPEYHQHVSVIKKPTLCKLKKKGLNSYYFFKKKMRTKGIIDLERLIIVAPQEKIIALSSDWGKISDLSEELRKKYQANEKFWPIKASIFRDTKFDWFDEDDLKSWILKTAKFVRSRISTLQDHTERLGAYRAFKERAGDCDEFTDLFVTLARKRGIPSRRITGYYIESDSLKATPHAWAEIHSSKNGWTTIDIAMGNIGRHTKNYVVLKLEEFNSDLPDYQVKIEHDSKVDTEWIRQEPVITSMTANS
ncbi:MAG: transglutaminase-like domain-containing protein [Candidatus Hodarchaeales archaeon]